jgi:multiple sugar transport system permease protein
MAATEVTDVTRRRKTSGAIAARPAGRPRYTRKLRDNTAAYVFMVGAIFCFALFSWYPMIREVIMSFQKTNFAGETTWVGLANYRHIVHDPSFWSAWRATALFAGLALVFGYAVPFVTAVVLNEIRHWRGYFRLLVYLPVMLPPIVAALLWKWFYDPGPGLFNSVLGALHLPQPQWLDSTSTAMVSLVLVSTWANMGSATLVYLAALQTIPGDLYEAAELDGAGLWQRLRHVTIPQTRFVLAVMLLLQVVATMQVFTEPYVMTGGGPQDATVTVLLLIYRYAFVYNDFGTASAMSVLLFVVLGVFSAAYLRLSRRSG